MNAGPGSLGSLGTATVDVTADLSELDKKLKDAEQKIRTQMLRNKLAMKQFAVSPGEIRLDEDQAAYNALMKAQKELTYDLMAVAKAQGLATGKRREDAAITQQATEATRQYAAAMRGAAGAAAAGSGAIGQAGNAGSKGAMGLLMLAQAIDDVQYGFKAVVNNIPGVLMAFGVPSKAAGAISIAGVALNQFSEHWKDWVELAKGTPFDGIAKNILKMGEAFTQVRGDAERLKEFAENKKTHEDLANEAVASVKGKGEMGRAQGVREAIEAMGGGKAVIDMLNSATQGLDGGARIALVEQIKREVAAALTGDAEAFKALRNRAGGTALAGALDAATPEAKKFRADWERVQREEAERAEHDESETERGNRIHAINKQLREWREEAARKQEADAKADALKQRADAIARRTGMSPEAAMQAVRDQDQQRIKAEMAKAGLVGSQTMGIDQLFRSLQEAGKGAPTQGEEKIVAEQKETTAAVRELNQTLRQKRFGAQFGR